MKIELASVMVDDQEKALDFYTRILGFVKRLDIPMGAQRWLTVVSAEQPAGVQLVLEPLAFAPARTFQKALFDAGIPLTSFAVADCCKEFARLRQLGVVFRVEPMQAGPVTRAVFEDTCGNLISMHQV